ncbi:MAG: hypothetical protein MZV63_33370 [Marinilabiliales bacterium]|nr:hypothetical protein [Marinilabiliales bacterium]
MPAVRSALQRCSFAGRRADIPHFGEAMVIAGVCDCGFRHSDTILLTQKEPVRYVTARASDCSRSGCQGRYAPPAAPLRIPELGVDIEPGFASGVVHIQCGGRPGPDRGRGGICHALGSGGGKPGGH